MSDGVFLLLVPIWIESVLGLGLSLTITVLFDKPLMSPPFPCLGLIWDQGGGCCFLPYQLPAEPDINRVYYYYVCACEF